MGFKKLTSDDQEQFASVADIYMDLQVARDGSGNYVMVIGATVSLTIDEQLLPQLQNFRERPAEDIVDGVYAIERWKNDLEDSPDIRPVESLSEALEALGFLHLGFVGSLDPVPVWPNRIYEHLHFTASAAATRSFTGTRLRRPMLHQALHIPICNPEGSFFKTT